MYLLGGILILLTAALLFIISPPGKRLVRDKALVFLRSKLNTEVNIGAIEYSLPKMVGLRNLLLKDQAGDTLLSAGALRIDIDLLELLSNKVSVNDLVLENVYGNVYRNKPDTDFNFTYIIDAFASKDTTTKDTNKSPFVFDVGTVRLKDIHIRFADEMGGSDLRIDLVAMKIKMRELDPSKMVFRLKSLAVQGLSTSFKQDTSLIVSSDTSVTKPITLQADILDLKEIVFSFQSSLSKINFDIQLQKLLAHPTNIDLVKRELVVKDFSLEKMRSKILLGKTNVVPERVAEVSDTLKEQGWSIVLNKIKLQDISFEMDDENKPQQKQGIDYAHLGITDLNFEAKEINYAIDNISGKVEHLTAKEKSGLDLQELRTNFSYNDTAASLQELFVQTPHSHLQNKIRVQYPSIKALSDNLAALEMQVLLTKSVVGMQDVLLFAPQLREQEMFKKQENTLLYIDAKIDGFLDDLKIAQLQLSAFDNTKIDINGVLQGLPDSKKLAYNFNIKTLQSANKELQNFIPASFTENLRLPAAFSAVGKLSGTAKDYYPNLKINTTDGNATIDGILKMSGAKGQEKYDLDVHTMALNIGKIIKRDTLIGAITAKLKVKGTSFDVKKMTAVIDGSVQSAMLKGYAYKSIKFEGKLSGQQGNLSLVSADPNAHLNLIASADLRNQYPSFLADLVIDSMDLQALKLYNEELRVQAKIHADVPDANPDYPNGIISIQNPVVAANSKIFVSDSIYLSSKPNADSGQNIKANLSFLQATISGKIPLKDIPAAIQEHINRHYKMDNPSDSILLVKNKTVPKQDTGKLFSNNFYNLNLNAVVYRNQFLEALAPELKSMDTVNIVASMDQNSLDLNVQAPKIMYGENDLKEFNLVLTERDSGMKYVAQFEGFSQGKIELNKTKVDGAIDANLISANFETADKQGVQRFAFGAKVQKEGSTQAFSLREGLMLDYNNWAVAQPNKIVMSKEGFYAENVKLSGNGASIVIESETPKFNAPLTASISNLRIADIMGIVSGDTLLADGVLAGAAKLKQIKPIPLIDADFSINNFSYNNDTLGNIMLKAANINDYTINTKATVIGNGNDLAITGDYFTKQNNGNDFNFDIVLNVLNLKSFEGFAQNNIRNSSGFISGKINAKGTTKLPLLNGDLTTDNLKTTVSTLNATFKMPKEKITFSPSGLNLDNFKILDSTNNVATIDGDIFTKNLSDLKMDLRVKAKNWRALSSTKTDNKLYFGNLILTTNLDIHGSITKPNVSGSLNILKGTNLSIVLPDRGLGLEDEAGIVVFVDKNDTGRIKASVAKDSNLFAKVNPNSEINVNITTDPESEFNVVIDQATGDFLTVRGKAALNTAIDPGGNLTLNGVYELYSGVYQLNYNLIKRKFEIQKGSVITFAGDPLKADMGVTASYKANVAPYTLVEKQVPDASQLVYYRQALPFDVQLKLNGPLLLPQISFDIVLPENNTYRISSDAVQLVQAKLSQLRADTSELNKQVFALLILKRFITDDPFAAGNGTNASFAAKQSVSRFIGEQLNQFANQLIDGVDFSVDLASTEDYTTGERRERTDLNIAASKRLFNDRLKVTIGNNFELEGPQTKSTDPNSSVIPGNLAIDYSLSVDNRYMVRAYRQSQDQGVIQGFVTETGVNFIVSYDYNRFRNLFIRKKVLEMRRKERLKQTTTKE